MEELSYGQNLYLILFVFSLFAEKKTKEKSFKTSTPRAFLGGATEEKIQKVGPNNFDDLSVWNAILSSPQTKIEKFDELKNSPRVWIGQLECSIVAVGGAIEAHGLGVLPFGLQKESAKWLLKFDFENEDATWAVCK